jgi:hypothetical protein
MTTIIDLTTEIDTPIDREIRPRKQPTCSCCNALGHQVRSCTDPAMMAHRRQIFQKIDRREPPDNILLHLQTLTFPLQKVVMMKTINQKPTNIAPYSCKNPQEFHAKVTEYVETRHREQENSIRRQLLAIPPRLIYTWLPRSINDITELYTRYCAQFTPGDHPPHIEQTQFIIFITQNRLEPTLYDPYPTYHTMVRWKQFLFHRRDQTLAEISRNRTHYVANVAPVTRTAYTFVRNIAKTNKMETIDCPICFETVSTPNISAPNCGHQFCSQCIRNTIKKYNAGQRCPCPMCRAPIQNIIRKDLAPPAEPTVP